MHPHAPPSQEATDSAAPERPQSLEQLERGLAVLQVFSREHPALTVSDVARLTGISRATARRILLTLKHLGHVKSEGRYFSLTPRVLDLGWAYFSSLGLDEVAQPIMRGLVQEIDESCSLATLDLPDIVYVARVYTPDVRTISGGIGARLPAHVTATGRVLLAALSDADFDRFLTTHPLHAYTTRTIVDPDQFRAVIEQVRSQRWALVDQEYETGLRAVAAPVQGRDGHTVAALSISSNSARTTRAELKARGVPAVTEAAKAISAAVVREAGRGGDR